MKSEYKSINNKSIFHRIIASALLAVLTVTLIGQTIHIHIHTSESVECHSCDCDHSDDHDNRSNGDHDHHSCMLCHFTLSDFTEAKLPELLAAITLITDTNFRYIRQEDLIFPSHIRGRSPPTTLS